MTQVTGPATGRAFHPALPVTVLLYLLAAATGMILGGPAERTFALVLAAIAVLRLIPPLSRARRARRDRRNGHGRV
ncbi:hypothetical protein ACIF6K_23530 [Streptomyces sp. NPDC085942]|uniref:hypothetical protein n=1 Tax=Streptomyces sp. NPDC085942 TaxID=3365743 RepID=UPI0037D98BEA